MPTPANTTEPLTLTFRADGWFNMTKAAKAFGKPLGNFWAAADTAAYLEEVIRIEEESLNSSNSPAELFVSRRGYGGGTWAHPKLAVFFARWLDVKFAVWCDAVIEDILKGRAEVVITAPDL